MRGQPTIGDTSIRDDKPRKKGSNVLAFVIGVALIALGACTLLGVHVSLDKNELARLINGGSSALFGIVLFWWAISERKTWGIGFETVTMVVGVVTAVIAIFTWTHGS